MEGKQCAVIKERGLFQYTHSNELCCLIYEDIKINELRGAGKAKGMKNVNGRCKLWLRQAVGQRLLQVLQAAHLQLSQHDRSEH